MGTESEEDKSIIDVVEIQRIIPHRYPFLLVDRIIEFVDNQKVVGIKNVTANEYFFQGHFPGKPVMPGVLILEAMAQTAGILAKLSTDGVADDKTMYFVGANDVRWKRQVVPGDTLRIQMTTIKKRRPLWMMAGQVTVEGKLVAEASISAAEAN